MNNVFLDGVRIAAVVPTGQARWFMTDQVDSVNIVTNDNGDAISAIDYLPYGETWYQEGDTGFSPKYNSQELDKESGLYFFNARHYDPEIARFETADSVVDGEFSVKGWNRYMYVGGNPIMYKDPTGHKSIMADFERDRAAAAVSAEKNAFNKARNDMYNLSSAVYQPTISKVGDWERLSNSTVERELKIRLHDADSGFKSGIYRNTKTGKYVYAFAGTDGPDKKDWSTNASEAMGYNSPQHRLAAKNAAILYEKLGENLSFTGHSLGGGLAALASLRTGGKATVFNAAGLHETTIAENGGNLSNRHKITGYYVEGEALQEALSAYKAGGAHVHTFADIGVRNVRLDLMENAALAAGAAGYSKPFSAAGVLAVKGEKHMLSSFQGNFRD